MEGVVNGEAKERSGKNTRKQMNLAAAQHRTECAHPTRKGENEEQIGIYTPFFSLSNGSTRDGAEVLGKKYPYLKIKDCPLDIEATEQLQTISLDAEDIEVVSCDTAGYVLKVRIGEEEVNGEEFRKNYNLVSSCFSIQKYEGKLRVTTRGVGHGIGLSQNTANKMAESGKTAEEILKYFHE